MTALTAWHDAAEVAKIYRYRGRMKERHEASQNKLHELEQKLHELRIDTRQLAARQKMMTELVDLQEYHICLLVNSKVCPGSATSNLRADILGVYALGC